MKKTRADYYGNKATKRLHNASRNNDRCRLSQIKKANVVRFDTVEAATAANYRKCAHCFEGE